jgi:ABC-2 type transport system permease protein
VQKDLKLDWIRCKMRQILYLLQKEFTQIFRDKFLGKVIFIIPLVQILILAPAITFEVKNLKLAIIDNDHSVTSRALINKFASSPFYTIAAQTNSEDEAYDLLGKDKVDVIINISNGLSDDLTKFNSGDVQVIVNAVNGSAAQLAAGYTSGVILDYNKQIIANSYSTDLTRLETININHRFWYNSLLNYYDYMVPGILVILITAIGLLFAGLNLVKEKEMGTIEQINVSPIKKYQFITAKLIPFLLIGIIDLAIGLGVSKLVFGIQFNGSVLLMLMFTVIYLFAVLGLGLFVSSFASTQQQYMFTVFAMIMIYVLMSGIFTPFNSMPEWAKIISYIVNPSCYFVKVNRAIMLKGSGFNDLLTEFGALSLLAVFYFSIAIARFRKTT